MIITEITPLVLGTPWRNLIFLKVETDEGLVGVSEARSVNRTEAVLKEKGKEYEFHRYDGAGHAFFCADRAAYRPEQAVDGWKKVFEFYGRHLATEDPTAAI